MRKKRSLKGARRMTPVKRTVKKKRANRKRRTGGKYRGNTTRNISRKRTHRKRNSRAPKKGGGDEGSKFLPGQAVMLTGLTDDTTYNNMSGEIISYDYNSKRYNVDIRPKNTNAGTCIRCGQPPMSCPLTCSEPNIIFVKENNLSTEPSKQVAATAAPAMAPEPAPATDSDIPLYFLLEDAITKYNHMSSASTKHGSLERMTDIIGYTFKPDEMTSLLKEMVDIKNTFTTKEERVAALETSELFQKLQKQLPEDSMLTKVIRTLGIQYVD